MKIMMLVHTYYPYTDGMQAVTQYQAEGLVERGHEVTVVTSYHPDALVEENYHGVHIIRFSYKNKHGIYFGEKKAYISYVLKESGNMDLIIPIGMQAPQTDWFLPLVRRIKCKKVLYLHGMEEFKWHCYNVDSIVSVASKMWYSFRWGMLYFGSRKYMRQFDAILQLHRFDSAYLFCEKYNISKSYVIENAVNDEFFKDNLEHPPKVADKYIICVANFLRGKNQKMCLEAFYRSVHKNYEMVFIGSQETDYLLRLKQWNRELKSLYGEKKVHFFVEVPRNQIASYVKHASVYLFGSISEKYPVSIAESMAAGVPFISTNVGSVRYLPGGIIANNVEEMAYALDLLLGDRRIAKSYGAAGRYYADRYMREKDNVDILEKYLLEITK